MNRSLWGKRGRNSKNKRPKYSMTTTISMVHVLWLLLVLCCIYTVYSDNCSPGFNFSIDGSSPCKICSTPLNGFNYTISPCNATFDTQILSCSLPTEGFYTIEPCQAGNSSQIGQNTVISPPNDLSPGKISTIVGDHSKGIHIK